MVMRGQDVVDVRHPALLDVSHAEARPYGQTVKEMEWSLSKGGPDREERSLRSKRRPTRPLDRLTVTDRADTNSLFGETGLSRAAEPVDDPGSGQRMAASTQASRSDGDEDAGESEDLRHRVLAVATEWWSAHGGLSTFNRQLCSALAAAGARVFCVVLSASPDERNDAAAKGVTLVEPSASPGAPALAALARRPILPPGVVPDVIIGHGRITGPAAQSLTEDHFPEARRLHIVHMAPDEIEWYKLGRSGDAGERAEELTRIELDLGRTAYRVVAIGPRLHARYLNELSAFDTVAPLRLDPGFDVEGVGPRHPPPGAPLKILLVGRAEPADAPLKGLDLAARAVGLAARRRGTNATEVELVVRGAPQGSSETLRRRLRSWAKLPSLHIVVRPYSTQAERLAADLLRASVAIMPSRTEGFGLVGVEAILVGTPVLVSSSSGVGGLLREVLQPDEAMRFIVPMSGDDDEDAEQWGRAIEAVLRDRDAAFGRTDELRRLLAQRKPWSAAVAGLLAALDEPASSVAASSSAGSPRGRRPA